MTNSSPSSRGGPPQGLSRAVRTRFLRRSAQAPTTSTPKNPARGCGSGPDGPLHKRAEARLVTQRLERRLDRGAGGGEPRPLRGGTLQAVERRRVLAAQGVRTRAVVGAHRVVDPSAHAPGERLARPVPGGPGAPRAP